MVARSASFSSRFLMFLPLVSELSSTFARSGGLGFGFICQPQIIGHYLKRQTLRHDKTA